MPRNSEDVLTKQRRIAYLAENPAAAEIHVAVAPHGVLVPELMPDQIRTPVGSPPFWWLAQFPGGVNGAADADLLAVPGPTTGALLCVGLMGLISFSRGRRRA